MGRPDDREQNACAAGTDPAEGAGLIALVGDVHSAWEFCDVAYFNRTQYELLLVAGDLGGSQARDGARVASSMARLTRRTLVLPGNNDVEEYGKIAAELTYRRGRADLLEELQPNASEPAELPRLCGFSSHRVTVHGLEVSVVAARPFAKGGSELSYPDALERSFGVRTLEESMARLRELVDQAATEHLVFFAHNGPTGLGDKREDLWGRDFDPDQGDWGDRDLRDAIDYARARGRRTLAVVAGHMHWALRGGGQRRWQRQQDGVLYINVSRVPRVFDADGGRLRSHIALALDRDGARAREVLVPEEQNL